MRRVVVTVCDLWLNESMNNTATHPHTIKVTSRVGRAGKGRKAECSCGWIGGRISYAQFGGFKGAQAEAEADGAEHVAEMTGKENAAI